MMRRLFGFVLAALLLFSGTAHAASPQQTTLLLANRGPSLSLNFLNGVLDGRLQFTRASTRTCIDATGTMVTLAANVSCFDHDPVTHLPIGLLIEEQRANIALYSSQMNLSPWGLGNSSFTTNQITSPDNTVDAGSYVENTAASVLHYANQAFTKPASATTYALSFFAKGKGREIGFSAASGPNGVAARCNPNTGSLSAGVGSYGTGFSAVSSGIAAAGGGWYRCYMVFTSDATTALATQISLWNTSLATNVYTGDGVSGGYIWCVQLESGTLPTSCIQTGAAAATRAADNAYMPTGPWFNPNAGTLIVKYLVNQAAASGTQEGIVRLDDGSDTNEISLFVSSPGYATLYAQIASAAQASSGFSAPFGVPASMGISYGNGVWRSTTNGVTPITGAGKNTTFKATTMRIGSSSTVAGSWQANGHIIGLDYYTRPLTAPELQGKSR